MGRARDALRAIDGILSSLVGTPDTAGSSAQGAGSQPALGSPEDG